MCFWKGEHSYGRFWGGERREEGVEGEAVHSIMEGPPPGFGRKGRGGSCSFSRGTPHTAREKDGEDLLLSWVASIKAQRGRGRELIGSGEGHDDGG